MAEVKTKIGEKVGTYKIKILSPVHIGTGNKLTKLDFTIRGSYLLVLNIDKAIDFLLQKNFNTFSEEILDRIAENKFSWNYYFPEGKRIPEELIKYKVELNPEIKDTNENKVKIRDIWEAIKKDNKDLYIPASEVKGFIRTAIVYKYMKDNWNEFKNEFQNVSKKFNFKRFIEEGKIFGSVSQDPMKFLKIEDIYGQFKPEVNGAKLMLSPNKEDLIDYIETIRGGSLSFTFKIKLWEERLKGVGRIGKYIMNWKEACYEFTNDFLKAEIKFWEDVANGNLVGYLKSKNSKIATLFKQATGIAKKIKADLENLKDENSKEAPLLRIGKYTGYLNHTVGLLLKNLQKYSNSQPYNLAPLGNDIGAMKAKPFLFPLTRRVTLDNQTLGWCKLVEV